MSTHPPLFRDPRAPVRERARDLLERLAPDERVAMLHQFAPAVERLGLAAFRTGQEALHGVAWMGPATVFPQAVGLGATWNDELVRRVGEAVGREARAMRARDPRVGLNLWSPTVNLLRHPLWGRNEEGYSEDPRLTAALATAYTRGLRGDDPVRWRTAPVLKHWLAHNNETDRDTCSVSVRSRVLHEYELPAFRGPVAAGAVAGVMPAYNLVNGRPNHLSPLLAEQLRTWCDHDLVVCSDAGAPSNLAGSQGYCDTHEEAVAAALRAGVDSFTDHGEDPAPTLARVRGALERGLLKQEDVDTAVLRLLAMRCALGEFDPEPPGAEDTGAAFDTPGHRALAREAAEQAVVLLKNDGLLPLAGGVRVAVVGLLADECKLDWYSGALLRRSTPLDGLRERFGAGRVTYAEGTDRVRLRCRDGWLSVPPSPPGGPGGDGGGGTAAGALDPALLRGRTDLPPLTVTAEPGAAAEFALADWGGGVLTLRAADGRYLSVADDGLLRASAEQPGGWVVRETFELRPYRGGRLLWHRGTGRYVTAPADGARLARDHEAGTTFTLETVERGTDAVADAARDADVVVVVAGNDPHIGGRETEDRTTLALPPHQERLWRAARAANPRTALVLVSSYPYAVREADAALPALLWTAHGGQAAGQALAAVLAGDVPPGGRLPQTWYACDADLPGLLDYDVIGARTTYLYFDGAPLYPFGHGLSYTSFAYGPLTAGHDGGTLTARCTVTNTGRTAGDEVVQLYARAIGVAGPEIPRPRRALAAHRRIRLAPGQTAQVEFAVPLAEALGCWDVAHDRWTVTPGTYGIDAGSSSTDLRTTAVVRVGGEPPRPRAVGSLRAADYDEQHGTELVDLTRERGDAVATAGPGPGELVFHACDFRARPTTVTVTAARAEPGEAEIVLHLDDPGGDRLLASLTVPATGDRYTYTTVRAELPEPPAGVRGLLAVLHGPVRLARLGFGGPSSAEST
ncbi:glycoside hydrolase family 3 C-terminal domain-containing protein [Streptomyces sp. TRM 70361]|uniref:glycoside hydrolase family 3 C-terminal domain-containing protein n=1 Tax=Streptomyces sp. TRM 70361 TaxID=3116553 RepID=UPI002E7B1884|nr:glycoside hydrolase family 3 C-terminal domain-containing protein [Streptomyces sp. TRM 70361]MEE1941814.1 glycoside hydrolase family 3 C-terminal domain-containing protein [Streptomyces sp. TRM 70361]